MKSKLRRTSTDATSMFIRASDLFQVSGKVSVKGQGLSWTWKMRTEKSSEPGRGSSQHKTQSWESCISWRSERRLMKEKETYNDIGGLAGGRSGRALWTIGRTHIHSTNNVIPSIWFQSGGDRSTFILRYHFAWCFYEALISVFKTEITGSIFTQSCKVNSAVQTLPHVTDEKTGTGTQGGLIKATWPDRARCLTLYFSLESNLNLSMNKWSVGRCIRNWILKAILCSLSLNLPDNIPTVGQSK